MVRKNEEFEFSGESLSGDSPGSTSTPLSKLSLPQGTLLEALQHPLSKQSLPQGTLLRMLYKYETYSLLSRL